MIFQKVFSLIFITLVLLKIKKTLSYIVYYSLSFDNCVYLCNSQQL